MTNRLREARERHGLTIGEVARFLGYDNSVVQDMEEGFWRLSEFTLAVFSRLYRRPIEYLRGDPVEPVAVGVRALEWVPGPSIGDGAWVRWIGNAEFPPHYQVRNGTWWRVGESIRYHTDADTVEAAKAAAQADYEARGRATLTPALTAILDLSEVDRAEVAALVQYLVEQGAMNNLLNQLRNVNYAYAPEFARLYMTQAADALETRDRTIADLTARLEAVTAERDEARMEVARYWTSADMTPWVNLAEEKGLGHFGKKLKGMFSRAIQAEDEARRSYACQEIAETERDTLAAHVARLLEALEPFAKQAERLDGIRYVRYDDKEQWLGPITIGEIRRARSAYAFTPEQSLAAIKAEAATVERLTKELAREEAAHIATIEQRDRAEEWADKLAYAIADESVIGEHSSHNNPWASALEIAEANESAALYDAMHGNVSETALAEQTALAAARGEALEPFAAMTASVQRRCFIQLLICPEGDNDPHNCAPDIHRARSALTPTPSAALSERDARIRREALEEAAKVAEDQAHVFDLSLEPHRRRTPASEHDIAVFESAASASREVAAAIRALADEVGGERLGDEASIRAIIDALGARVPNAHGTRRPHHSREIRG